MTLYHGKHDSGYGSHGELVIHEGLCLTDAYATAEHYAQGGTVHEVEIADDLTIECCEGYDHDSNTAPADDADYRAAAAERGVDVLRYEDEDEMGCVHDCYRLVSDRAVQTVNAQDGDHTTRRQR